MIATAALLALQVAAKPAGPAAAKSAQQSAAPTAPKTAGQAPGEPSGSAQAAGATADEARTSITKAVQFLLTHQNPDGSWGTSTVESLFELNYSNASFYAWKMAGGAICSMALMAAEETQPRRDALERSLTWLCKEPLPKRGSEWDVDNMWTYLYGYNALEMAARDPRFQTEAWKSRIQGRALEFYAALEHGQDPKGGWGYYEGPVVSERPTWSTSFATASVIPSLIDGKALGWKIDQGLIDRATSYVRQCRLPTGAITYDLGPIPRITGGEDINNVKGSLGRIQVAHWALRHAGEKTVTDDVLRWGLTQFFENHKFLDAARLMPVPHESWYKNAGYFYYFGHYHAARVINLLPEAEREGWHAKLRRELVKTQWEDGASQDFPGSFYNTTYATSFSILALAAGLPGGEKLH